MYIAEIRGKIPREFEHKEDILTSNVFSFLKYSSRKTFLGPFLELLGVPATEKELQKAEFIFWPTYEDGTEPDVVILAGDHYILIEAKYTSGFGQETENTAHQLEREFIHGSHEAKALGKKFKIFALTNDVFVDEGKYPGIPKNIRKEITFINWQSITYMIEEILNSNLSLPQRERLMSNDLYDLLIKKGLRNYKGIDVFKDFGSTETFSEEIFYSHQTSKYFGEFSGFINRLGNEEWIEKPFDLIFLESGTGLFFGYEKRLGNEVQINLPNKNIFLERES